MNIRKLMIKTLGGTANEDVQNLQKYVSKRMSGDVLNALQHEVVTSHVQFERLAVVTTMDERGLRLPMDVIKRDMIHSLSNKMLPYVTFTDGYDGPRGMRTLQAEVLIGIPK